MNKKGLIVAIAVGAVLLIGAVLFLVTRREKNDADSSERVSLVVEGWMHGDVSNDVVKTKRYRVRYGDKIGLKANEFCAEDMMIEVVEIGEGGVKILINDDITQEVGIEGRRLEGCASMYWWTNIRLGK